MSEFSTKRRKKENVLFRDHSGTSSLFRKISGNESLGERARERERQKRV
jgi:hypothetical protein